MKKILLTALVLGGIAATPTITANAATPILETTESNTVIDLGGFAEQESLFQTPRMDIAGPNGLSTWLEASGNSRRAVAQGIRNGGPVEVRAYLMNNFGQASNHSAWVRAQTVATARTSWVNSTAVRAGGQMR